MIVRLGYWIISLACFDCGRFKWPWQDIRNGKHHACRHAWGRSWVDRSIDSAGPFVKGDGRKGFTCEHCGWTYAG